MRLRLLLVLLSCLLCRVSIAQQTYSIVGSWSWVSEPYLNDSGIFLFTVANSYLQEDTAGNTSHGTYSYASGNLTLTDSNGNSTVFATSWSSPDKVFLYDGSTNNIYELIRKGNAYQPGKSLGPPGNKSGASAAGEPVDVATGNVTDQVTDYSTAGPNPLEFDRTYNSMGQALPFVVDVGPSWAANVDQDLDCASSTSTSSYRREEQLPQYSHNRSQCVTDGDVNTRVVQGISASQAPLGPGWTTNFDRYLYVSSSTSISAYRQDGQILQYSYNGSEWVTDSDVNSRLTATASGYTLTTIDGTVETYDTVSAAEGRLASITALNGYTQTLHYNGSGQYTTVTDSYGRTLTFVYRGSVMRSVTTPDQTVISFEYNSAGVLIQSQHSGNPKPVRYRYADSAFPFAITSLIDENGNTYLSWSYDGNGRCISTQFGSGAYLTTFDYTNSPVSTTVTNALGQQNVYQLALNNGILKITGVNRVATSTVAGGTIAFDYDSKGYLSSFTDWNGNSASYSNDALGRPVSITEASGSALARTTTVSYFGPYNLPATVVAPDITSTFSYDADANLIARTDTDTTTSTVPYRTAGQARTWKYTWANGLMTSSKSPLGLVDTFAYDASGALVKTTNPLGQVTQVVKHTNGGRPLDVLDANGVHSTFTFDFDQRILSSSVLATSGPITTSYSRDNAGNLLTVEQGDGSITSYAYDDAHRLIGQSNLLKQKIAYSLDGLGDQLRITAYDANGTATAVHSDAYDSLGRLLLDTGGNGQETAFTYDGNGNQLTVSDPAGNVTGQTFDALNRVVTITDALNGVTSVAFDAQDNPVSVTAANGATTNYVYDGLGDLIEQSSPDSGRTVFYFDADGNLVKKFDGTNAEVEYSYDGLDRLAGTTYPGDPAENVHYFYDQPGSGFGIGEQTSMTDAAGTLKRTFNERGLETAEVRTVGTKSTKTQYAYDGADRIVGITYPTGLKVAYARDASGQIQSVTASGAATGTIASNIGYQPFGPVNSLTFGNGLPESRGYDADYRLTKISAGAGSVRLQNQAYGYDPNSNVTAIVDGINSARTQSFGYDALNRLVGAKGAYGNLGYTYDSVANRITQLQGTNLTTYGYQSHSNRLTSLASGGVTQAVTTTKAGDIAAIGGASGEQFSYNQAGRLASVASSGATVGSYDYDGAGRRTLKTASGKTTLFQYDQFGRMLEARALTGGGTVDYIFLDDGRPLAMFSASGLDYVSTDQLGTPQLVTSPSGEVLWSAAYTPFGQTTPSSSFPMDLRLPGQYADAESGLNQNYFRDYAPALGRYVESDPLGLLGGMNTYGYVDGNPLAYNDPIGLGPLQVLLSVFTIGGATSAATDWPSGPEGRIASFLGGGAGGLALISFPADWAPLAPFLAPILAAGVESLFKNDTELILDLLFDPSKVDLNNFWQRVGKDFITDLVNDYIGELKIVEALHIPGLTKVANSVERLIARSAMFKPSRTSLKTIWRLVRIEASKSTFFAIVTYPFDFVISHFSEFLPDTSVQGMK